MSDNLMRLIDDLCEKVLAAHEAEKNGQPFERCMVALVGVPASGKTTAANIISDLVRSRLYNHFIKEEEGEEVKEKEKASTCESSSNKLKQRLLDMIVVTPMDGYHLTRERLLSDHANWLASLETSPSIDAASAENTADTNSRNDKNDPFARRGAYWTFDAEDLSKALSEVKQGYGKTIRMHGWSHALKDPSFDAISVPSKALMVIVEGLYLLLEGDESVETWSTRVAPLFNTRILLECDPAIAANRGSLRNWKAGISESLEASRIRWFKNDDLNAKLILEHLNKEKLDVTLRQEDFGDLAIPYLKQESEQE